MHLPESISVKGKTMQFVLSVVSLSLIALFDVLIIVVIWNAHMLPTSYYFLIIGALLLLYLVTALILFFRNKNPKPIGMHFKIDESAILRKQWARVAFGLIVLIATCLFYSFVLTATSKLSQTITAITEKVTTATVYNVYVRYNDDAQKITDLSGYVFGVSESDETDDVEKCIGEIESELSDSVQYCKYSNITKVVDGLYTSECDAIMMNSVYEEILLDFDEYSDFLSRARLVYQIAITEEEAQNSVIVEPEISDVEESADATVPDEVVEITTIEDITNTPFVVYLSGSDTRNEVLTTSRSDVNILVVVNPSTKEVLLINTPRDYYVQNPAGNGEYDKLTHCGIYGVDCSVGALSLLYGVNIDYYVQINFSGFETLVDAIGGIEVYSDMSFVAQEGNYYISEGWNHLDGSQALGFVRERYSFASGDNQRGLNQMKVITAIIEKLSISTVVRNYSAILDSLQGMVSTNVSEDAISALIRMQLNDMATWNVHSYAVTGEGGSELTYSLPDLYAYVMYPDEDSVSHAVYLISKVFDGDVLTDEDLIVP